MTKPSKLPLALIGRCFLVFWILLLTYFVFANLDISNKIAVNIDSTNGEKHQIQAIEIKLIALSEELLTIQQNLSSLQNADKAIQDKNQQAMDAIYIHLGQYAQLSDTVLLLEKLDQQQEAIQRLRDAETAKPTQPTPAVVSASDSPRPQAVRPTNTAMPFKVIGRELRGGETLLTVMPTGSASIAAIQLLRPGQSMGNWMLQSVNDREAVFKAGAQTRRLPIPSIPN